MCTLFNWSLNVHQKKKKPQWFPKRGHHSVNRWGKCVFNDWVWITAAAVGNKWLFLSLLFFSISGSESISPEHDHHIMNNHTEVSDVTCWTPLRFITRNCCCIILKPIKNVGLRLLFQQIMLHNQQCCYLERHENCHFWRMKSKAADCSLLSVFLWDLNLTLVCPIWATTPTRNCLGQGRSCGLQPQTWRRCVIICLRVTLKL